MAISFFVKGTAVSWRAPQFNRTTGNAYKPKAQGEKAWQNSVWGQAMCYAPKEPWTGPVRMDLIFYVPCAKSWPKWKKEVIASNRFHCDTGQDATNLRKAFEDALKGVFFVDDRQVDGDTIRTWVANPEDAGVLVSLKKLPGLPERKPQNSDQQAAVSDQQEAR